LLCQWSTLHGELGDNLCGIDVNSNDYSGVIEEIAMASKGSINDGPDLNDRWSLQNDSSNKVFRWIIIGNRAVNENRRIDIGQCVDVDSMEVVDTISRPSITSNTVIGDVGFGEEVDDISSEVQISDQYCSEGGTIMS
jgi:hypothetical protein